MSVSGVITKTDKTLSAAKRSFRGLVSFKAYAPSFALAA